MKKKRQQSSTLPLLIIGLGAALILGAVAWYLIASNQPVDVQTLPSTAESGAAGIERVSLADAKAAFDLGQAVFVDVRGANYYADRHIPGALSIPLADLPQRLGELDPEDWIVTYWTWVAEESSARAAQILIENGFSRATPIKGGFQAWVDSGYPTEP